LNSPVKSGQSKLDFSIHSDPIGSLIHNFDIERALAYAADSPFTLPPSLPVLAANLIFTGECTTKAENKQ